MLGNTRQTDFPRLTPLPGFQAFPDFTYTCCFGFSALAICDGRYHPLRAVERGRSFDDRNR